MAKVIILCRNEINDKYKFWAGYEKKKHELINSESEFWDYIDTVEIKTIPYCIFQFEINWNNQKHYSLKIAERLRRLGALCPMYFCTSKPKTLFDLKLPLFAILRAKKFHQLINPITRDELLFDLSSKSMVEYKRLDIVKSLLSNRSLAREVLHELKNKILALSEQNDFGNILPNIESKFKELELMFPVAQKDISAIYEKIKDQVLEFLNQEKKGEIAAFIDSYKKSILDLLPEEYSHVEKVTINADKSLWKVLMFEDDLKLRKSIKDLFISSGIQCISLETGKEVLDTLKKDQSKNEITVLICDIRILENEHEWHEYQGYDIMWEVRQNLTNMVEIVALTSGSSRLIDILEDDDIKIHRRLKQDVLSSDGAKRMFVQGIKELGDNVFFKLRSRPRQASWIKGNKEKHGKPLSYFYREHLMSSEYLRIENWISTEAEDFIKSSVGNNPVENNQRVAINFTGTIKDAISKENNLDKFRERVLIGRRIALALYLKYDLSDEEIYRRMMFVEKNKTVKKTDINQLLTTCLALSFKKDIPTVKDIESGDLLNSGLLVEEIEWLIEKFNIGFNISKIRMSKKEKTSIVLSLDELRDELKKEDIANTNDKVLNGFFSYDFDKVSSVKEAIKWFKLSYQYADKFGKLTFFKKLIKRDLEDGYFYNEELCNFLQKTI